MVEAQSQLCNICKNAMGFVGSETLRYIPIDTALQGCTSHLCDWASHLPDSKYGLRELLLNVAVLVQD